MNHRILLVEDDPRLQKLFEIILGSAGFVVSSAASVNRARELLTEGGLPDAVVVDLLLPTGDSFELVRTLRELPNGDAVPVLALSGSVTKLSEAQASSLGFVEFLVKPVDKVALLDAVQRHLPLPSAPNVGEGRRVLVVDDSPLQAKLARLRLMAAGFEVATAADGIEGLELARSLRPDAVVSDVIMPRMDGFQLCQAIRQDSQLRDLVVILVSASYVDEPIRLLGQQAGANDFLMRTPDLTPLMASLRNHLSVDEPPPFAVGLPSNYVPTLFSQLERQVMLNQGLARRCTQLGTSLSLLASLSSSLTRTPDVRAGALAMLEQLVLDGRFALAGLRMLDDGEGWQHRPVDWIFSVPPDLEERCLQTRCPQMQEGLLLTPIVLDEETIAVLALREGDTTDPEGSLSFARVVAAQVAQGLAMARVLADQAETQERFNQLSRHIDEAFWLAKADVSQVLFVSHAYERIWGQGNDQLLRGDPQSFLEAVHPEDRPRFLDELRRLQGGQEVHHEFRVVHPDGSVRHLSQRCFPIRNETGQVYRVCGVDRDVTEQRVLEQQFRQAQKMEALGRLAGGVAHDFNNLLTVITGFGELALSELAPQNPAAQHLSEILRASERAALLTRQLLTFSKREVPQPVVLDVNEVLTEMARMLTRVIGEDLQMRLRPCAERATARIDRGHLEQVVMNLAVNARDAMPGGGELSLETSLVTRPEGRFVLLTVTDTGTGMDEEVLQRLFEPFFTTKGQAGTGLGLATAFGIVRGAGGALEPVSEPGRGTTMRILLPYCPEIRTTARAKHAAEPLPGGTETILLVEDDDAVRRMTKTALARLGYRVLEARNDREARGHCESHAEPLQLLLSDVVMPEVSGPELAQILLEIRPELRILLMSGYTDVEILRFGILEKGLAYLEKPFTPARLARKVREVLDRHD